MKIIVEFEMSRKKHRAFEKNSNFPQTCKNNWSQELQEKKYKTPRHRYDTQGPVPTKALKEVCHVFLVAFFVWRRYENKLLTV